MLLGLFVRSVLFVFLLLFLSFAFLILAFVCHFLQGRAKLELAFKGSKFSLHSNDAFFVGGFGAPCTFLLEEVELVCGKEDEFLMTEGDGAVSVSILLALDVCTKVVAGHGGVGGE